VKPRGGAPKGNLNALKHGYTTAARLARQAEVRALLRSTRELMAAMKAQYALRVAMRVPTRSAEYVFTIQNEDGSIRRWRTTMVFSGRHPISKTVENLTIEAPASAAKSVPQPLTPSAPRARIVIRSRANSARKTGLSRRSARSKRARSEWVLTELQNQHRTIPRVSDLFAGDSSRPHGER